MSPESTMASVGIASALTNNRRTFFTVRETRLAGVDDDAVAFSDMTARVREGGVE